MNPEIGEPEFIEPTDDDAYVNVPPPSETDGPQEPVDPDELEEEAHAVLPGGVENDDDIERS